MRDPNTMRAGPTKWRAEHCTTHHHACDCREWEYACKIERLEAALEAAREDAERYRWLRDSPERPCRVPCAYAVMPGDVEYPTPLGGETLDAAIDQARGIVPEAGQGVGK